MVENSTEEAQVQVAGTASQMKKPPLHSAAAVNLKTADAAMQLTN